MIKKIKLIFKPTIHKLFVPLLILTILLVISVFNIIKLPELGEYLYSFEENYEKVRYAQTNLSAKSNIKPFFNLNYTLEDVERSTNQASQKLNRAQLINLIFICPNLNILTIYPNWPVPCSLNVHTSNCYHYIPEDTYIKFEKLTEYRSNIISDETNTNFFGTNVVLKDYREIKLSDLILHSLFISFSVFVFICLTSYLFKTLSKK